MEYTTNFSILKIGAVNPKPMMIYIYQVAIINQHERNISLRGVIYQIAIMNSQERNLSLKNIMNLSAYNEPVSSSYEKGDLREDLDYS